jgi:NAD-dependent deacetylase
MKHDTPVYSEQAARQVTGQTGSTFDKPDVHVILPQMKRLLDLIARSPHTVALTGAGISTLCGIPDFRGPQGLYRQPGAERIFDIDWFRRDPTIYYEGCRTLIYGLNAFQPGPVHQALVRLEREAHLHAVITQNIDMLHQKAGTRRLVEIHGSPLLHHCTACGREASFEQVCLLIEHHAVASCERCGGPYKPNITFFGEMLPEAALNDALELARTADLMLVLGSSLTVNPAASLPRETLRSGGKLVIINAQPTPLDDHAVLCYPDLNDFANAVLKL